jgi:endonuclease YncB( thermonuclease family)
MTYSRSLFAALTFALGGVANADPIIGRASVVDGDTIEIHGQRIRIHGVDAPESNQLCLNAHGGRYRCGQQAAIALDKFLSESRPTYCSGAGKPSYGRVVARCERADGQGVAEYLVENGHAIDWPKYSKGEYEKAQNRARAAKRGIWQGDFEMPCMARNRKSPRC